MKKISHIDKADCELLARDLSRYLLDSNETYLEALIGAIYMIKYIESANQKASLEPGPYNKLVGILFDLCIPVIHIQHLCHILSMVNPIEPMLANSP